MHGYVPYDMQVVLQFGFGDINGFMISTTALTSVLMCWVGLGLGHEIVFRLDIDRNLARSNPDYAQHIARHELQY
jgi:hypothetical protein